jgi:hypothetical protein
MKLVSFECKKIMSFKIFWVIFACFFAVNAYIQFDRINDRHYTPESYRAFFAETKDMSLDEIQDYTNEMLERQNNGEYIEFPMMLVYDMSILAEECKNYPEYLNSIKKQTDSMSSVTIWGNNDTFSYRNIKKTPSAYKNLSEEPLPLAASFGLENTFTSPFTDLLGIFLVFMAVCGIILKDREQGVMSLLLSMPKGKTNLIVSKLTAISIITSFIAVLLFAENLIIGGILYGIGDLHRPIQSVFGFYQCNLALTVGEFLLLFFIVKIAAYLLFAMIFSLICTISKNNLVIYIVSGTVCLISFLCYKYISQNSAFQLIHYWNPIKFTQTTEIFNTYQNVNLFGYPVSLKISAIILIISVILLIALCCIFAVEKIGNIQYKGVYLKNYHRRKDKLHSRFFYICYRSLIINKGIILVFALIFMSAIFSASFSRQYSNDDIYYENFTTELSGKVTDDTLNFIIEKEQQYADVEKEIEKIQSSENVNIYKVGLLSKKLNDRTAFERLKLRVETIQANNYNGEIFYDTGYERFFNYSNDDEKIFMLLFMTFFLVMILSPIASSDKKTDMIKIIYSTKYGKNGYYKSLFSYSALCGLFSSSLFFIPYIISILNKYGTEGITASIQSIQLFSNLNIPFSVGSFIIFFIAIHVIVSIICSIAISGISSLCKSQATAYVINTSLFIIPIIVILLIPTI